MTLLLAMLAVAGLTAITAAITRNQTGFDPHTATLITTVTGEVTELPDTEAFTHTPTPCNHNSSPTGPDTGHATRAWSLPGGLVIAVTARSFPTEEDAYENTRELAASVSACTAYEQDGHMFAVRDVAGASMAVVTWDAKQLHDAPGDREDGDHEDEGAPVLTWTTTPGGHGTVWAATTDHTTVFIVGVSGADYLPDPGAATSILTSQISSPQQQ